MYIMMNTFYQNYLRNILMVTKYLYQIPKIFFIDPYFSFSLRTWLILLAAFVNAMGTTIPIFITLYLSTKLHFPLMYIAFIVSAYGLGSIVGSYVGGIICSRFNYHKISILMLLLGGVSTSILTFILQFSLFLFSMFITGLFYGAFKPANALNLLTGVEQSNHAKLNGLYRLSFTFALAIASLIGGIFINYSYQWIFWFDAVTSLMAAMLLLYFSMLFPVCSLTSKQKSWSFGPDLDKAEIILSIILLFNCMVLLQVRTTYTLYLNDYYHITSKFLSYILATNCIMLVLFEVPFLHIVKKFNQIIIAAIGSLLLCLGMTLLVFTNISNIPFISCVILAIGEILLFPTIAAILFNRTEERKRGVSLGFYQSIFSAATMLAPIVGGYIYSKNPFLLWYCCSGVGLGSLLLFYLVLWWRGERQELCLNHIFNK